MKAGKAVVRKLRKKTEKKVVITQNSLHITFLAVYIFQNHQVIQSSIRSRNIQVGDCEENFT